MACFSFLLFNVDVDVGVGVVIVIVVVFSYLDFYWNLPNSKITEREQKNLKIPKGKKTLPKNIPHNGRRGREQ